MKIRNIFKKKPSKGLSPDGTYILNSIYISGPMTGYEKFNYPAFDAAQKFLWETTDFAILSPHRIDGGVQIEGGEVKPYGYYFRKAMVMLLMCDHIIMLPGWENSKGATEELATARLCGMKVGFLSEPQSYGVGGVVSKYPHITWE